jgi:hypothetical protein
MLATLGCRPVSPSHPSHGILRVPSWSLDKFRPYVSKDTVTQPPGRRKLRPGRPAIPPDEIRKVPHQARRAHPSLISPLPSGAIAPTWRKAPTDVLTMSLRVRAGIERGLDHVVHVRELRFDTVLANVLLEELEEVAIG